MLRGFQEEKRESSARWANAGAVATDRTAATAGMTKEKHPTLIRRLIFAEISQFTLSTG
jgi:hypothetical protein